MSRYMIRGLSQSLYRYLPECWVDFSVSGERNNYLAQIIRWNSEQLEGINKRRLLRVVNRSIQSFKTASSADPTVKSTAGFGDALTEANCKVLTPKHDVEERGAVASISPLTFYCPACHKVYQFNSAETYLNHRKCKTCNVELKQFRQIYFCKCGFATDRHPVYCSKCHSNVDITWSGKLNDYRFHCKKCGNQIQMAKTCEQCGERLTPKAARDSSQYFAYTTNLIDTIDEKTESFISEKSYGPILTIALWLNELKREDFDELVDKGISDDPEKYEKEFQKNYTTLIKAGFPEEQARIAAEITANNSCGNNFLALANTIKGRVTTTEENLTLVAESILEYLFVKELKDRSTLDDASEISKSLNTNANPEKYKEIANQKGIQSAQVCGSIPFVSCSYGYTRVNFEPGDGTVLHAFREEEKGVKNVYASKLKTEGVLFEFDRIKILEWLERNDYIDRDELPDLTDEKAVKLWFVNNIKQDSIKPFSSLDPDEKATYYVYNLIHSISHLLIKSAANLCGLDKNSISEYIMPAIPAVLVYCQNSQGFNLGALFNVFEAYFDKWMETAAGNAQKCIFDPICIERDKACTGCLFLNEVSCQHFNHDLDRSLIIGTVDKDTGKNYYGFWEVT